MSYLDGFDPTMWQGMGSLGCGLGDLNLGLSSMDSFYGNSLFSPISGMMNPMMNCMPGFGMNLEQMKEWREYLKLQREQNMLDTLETQRDQMNFNEKFNAPINAIKAQAEVLQRQILDNKNQNITPEYNKLFNMIKEYYQSNGIDLSDEVIRSKVKEAYTAKTKSDLIFDIKEHGDSSFKTGFWNTFLGKKWLMNNETSKSIEENIQDITGENAYTGKDKALNNLGKGFSIFTQVVGGLVLLKLGRGVGKTLLSGLKWLVT